MTRDYEPPVDDPIGDVDEGEARPGADPRESSSRVLRFARRLMDRREDTREMLSAFLSSSDKVKTEAVRLMAREVRMYLSELKLKEDLMDLVRSHSLEISIHLKPLGGADRERDPPSEKG